MRIYVVPFLALAALSAPAAAPAATAVPVAIPAGHNPAVTDVYYYHGRYYPYRYHGRYYPVLL